MSFCNFGYDCSSWAVTKLKRSHWQGKARSDSALVGTCLLGCLLEGGSRILEADISFPKPEVSLWFAHQHQKQRYRMSPKMKHKYSFLHIQPHTKACFLICSCFYSHKKGCNPCRNQAFWFYWLVTLFSDQCPDVSKQYPSILEQFHYNDKSVVLNMECMLFSNFPLICQMDYR